MWLFDDKRNEMFDAMKVSVQQSFLFIVGTVILCAGTHWSN